jgi:hypothetical protein
MAHFSSQPNSRVINMNESECRRHVIAAIEDAIAFGEQKCGHSLPRKFVFKMLSKISSDESPMSEHETLDYLVSQLWINENEIYPCYDLGIAAVLPDETLVLSGNRAGYPPKPWQKNYTGRDGPFVLSIFGDWWREYKKS